MPSPARPRGVIAATATPVLADIVQDEVKARAQAGLTEAELAGLALAAAYREAGRRVPVVLGLTTGEATSFSLEQRLGVMRAIFDAGMPMHRFMVGTGLCSLDETATLTRAACEMRFAGALVLPPFFYPLVQADGLIAYVDALIARVDQPSLAIYLYHIPQNTQVPWPVHVVAELCRRHPAAANLQ